MTMRPDGTDQHAIPHQPGRRAANSFGACYSPDSRRIVFTRQTGPTPAELWLMDPNGANARPFLPDLRTQANWEPFWGVLPRQ